MHSKDSRLLFYLKAFTHLKTAGNRTLGPAPHKPVLLLAIFDLIQESSAPFDGRIYLEPKLIAYFIENWQRYVKSNHKPNVALPFFHLKNEKTAFWHLMPQPGQSMPPQLKSIREIRDYIDFAYLKPDLVELMNSDEAIDTFRAGILKKYFSKQPIGVSYEIQKKLESLLIGEAQLKYQILNEEDQIYLRNRNFQRELPRLYDYTCCISGLRFEAPTAQLVDACHIIPWSETRDDSASNGIVLEPTLHRAFDRGLIGIDANYQVHLSPLLKIEFQNVERILQFEGQLISLPRDSRFKPSPEKLASTFQSKFRA